jgi:hypothetical protein
VVSFTLLSLYPRGNSSRYALYRRLGGPQSRSGLCGEEKNVLSLPGIEPRLLSRPACSLVAIPTELARLHMYGVLSLIRQTVAQSARYYACQILPVWQSSPASFQQPRFEPCTFRINTSLERDRYSRLLGSVVQKATFFKFSALSVSKHHWPTVTYWPSTLPVLWAPFRCTCSHVFSTLQDCDCPLRRLDYK